METITSSSIDHEEHNAEFSCGAGVIDGVVTFSASAVALFLGIALSMKACEVFEISNTIMLTICSGLVSAPLVAGTLWALPLILENDRKARGTRALTPKLYHSGRKVGLMLIPAMLLLFDLLMRRIG
ncbi:MAG: hypothetical protein QY311_00215 [Candidatus Paceibacterota bacterium]|nr:MAG: hypothetical protein QY311_00215 [Candidatus Paceibacterota bacterium]